MIIARIKYGGPLLLLIKIPLAVNTLSLLLPQPFTDLGVRDCNSFEERSSFCSQQFSKIYFVRKYRETLLITYSCHHSALDFTPTLISHTLPNTCNSVDIVDASKENATQTSSHNSRRETATEHTPPTHVILTYFSCSYNFTVLIYTLKLTCFFYLKKFRTSLQCIKPLGICSLIQGKNLCT